MVRQEIANLWVIILDGVLVQIQSVAPIPLKGIIEDTYSNLFRNIFGNNTFYGVLIIEKTVVENNKRDTTQ